MRLALLLICGFGMGDGLVRKFEDSPCSNNRWGYARGQGREAVRQQLTVEGQKEQEASKNRRSAGTRGQQEQEKRRTAGTRGKKPAGTGDQQE